MKFVPNSKQFDVTYRIPVLFILWIKIHYLGQPLFKSNENLDVLNLNLNLLNFLRSSGSIFKLSSTVWPQKSEFVTSLIINNEIAWLSENLITRLINTIMKNQWLVYSITVPSTNRTVYWLYRIISLDISMCNKIVHALFYTLHLKHLILKMYVF